MSLGEFVHDHCYAIIIVLILLLVLVIVTLGMGIGLASSSSSSENLVSKAVTKVPWGMKSEEFTMPGTLNPAQQALYNRLSKNDPTDSRRMQAEYLSNKQETPTLVSKLYQ